MNGTRALTHILDDGIERDTLRKVVGTDEHEHLVRLFGTRNINVRR